MISIFYDLVNEKKIKLNIENYIEVYTDKYLSMNKGYQFYYDEYEKFKNISIELSLKDELESYKNERPEYYNFKSKIQTFFMQSCLLESLKRVIEIKSANDTEIQSKIKKYKKKYDYYPEISDYKKYEDFLIDFSLRKEFNIHHIPKNTKSTCDKNIFELAPHQLFLKNLFSLATPYNGILIFHGVGVGKTCSGVSIAENLKHNKRKTIILAPEKIQIGWKKTIFNPKNGENQCTGDEYNYEEDKYEKNKKGMADKRINEFYEMYGYGAFANMVKNYLNDNLKHISKNDLLLRKKEEIHLIQEKFSNRALIIDEVHKIRSEEEKITRDTILYIEKVILHSKNLKLILLTANPMFNQPTEIVWILNMLLMNDNRDKIKQSIKFEKDKDDKTILTKESKKLLEEKGKGYISYLRGENPFTFPYRLYPHQNIIQTVSNDIFGERIDEHENLQFLKLYGSEVKGKQKELYFSELEKLDKTIEMSEESKLMQISNCVFPNKSDAIEDLYGDRGIENCFKIKKKNQYSYRKGIPNFLDLDEIGNYSAKIESILHSINESDGIVFIYSNFLSGGILPLVLALEQNGYSKYDGANILLSDQKRDPISYNGEVGKDITPAKYMVIAGDSLKLTSDFKNELDIVTDETNKKGEKIKVIIGSTVAAEGLDFKNIRAIHLLEPWHNIHKLEQVIGRGIRNCSHVMLDDNERNITIYLHTSIFDKRESIETYLYRRCERKAIEIGNIELVLKQIAIDKYLFQNANLITEKDTKIIKVNPGHRDAPEIDINPYDVPYTRTCSFLADCDYFKDTEFNINQKHKLKGDTFSMQYSQPLIDIYKRKIGELIIDYYYLDLKTLFLKLNDKISNLFPDMVYLAIDQMINDKYSIQIPNQSKGYLNYSDNYYYYQPSHNPDLYLPTYYRVNKGNTDSNEYRLITDKQSLLNIPEIFELMDKEIEMKYDELLRGDLYKLSKREEYILTLTDEKNKPLFTDQFKYSYIIDRLKFKDKCILLYSVILLLVKDGSVDEKYNSLVKDLTQIFSPLFIYNNEETSNYEWLPKYEEKNIMNLFGGFIYFHERKEYYLFHYESRKLIVCNEIQKENILSNFALIPRKQIYNQKLYSYIEYNNKYKLIQNGIVLKIKTGKGKGSIFISQSTSEWTSETGLKYIQKKYPKDWSNIKEEMKNELEFTDYSGKYKINKLVVAVLIEILMRKNTHFIQGDLLWLFNYVKFD